MNSRKFSLRSLIQKIRRRSAPASAAAPAPNQPRKTARERVRSGIESLEGRIAPAVLLNARALSFTDTDGDRVTVTFSKDIFDLTSNILPDALKAVFKFDTGIAHLGAPNPTDDVPQQLQLIDLSQVPVRFVNTIPVSVVAGVSMSVTSEAAGGGDGLTKIGAVKAGSNALGTVRIDGDLGQIDAGTGTKKVGLAKLVVESIGRFGPATQPASPAPSLDSQIVGELGSLVVHGDMQGYIHTVDATAVVGGVNKLKMRGTIGKVIIDGSLRGDPTEATTSDDTGRIGSSWEIGDVRIGTDSTEGIFGGGGSNSGAITATKKIGNVTISGSVTGLAGASSGIISSGGKLGAVTVGGNLVGGAGAQSGGIHSDRALESVTIGAPGSNGNVTGGSGANSGLISSGGTLGPVRIFGSITGDGLHSGGIYSTAKITTVTVEGGITGGANASSGAIESLADIGTVIVRGDVTGGDGAASAAIVSGGALQSVFIGGKLAGGKGANSGAILAAHDPVNKSSGLGEATIRGALLGGEGASSGAIASGSAIGAIDIAATLSSGPAMKGGVGALSGSINANGSLDTLRIHRGVEGATGAYSASIQGTGRIGVVEISGDLAGGDGEGSASILAHEVAGIAREIAAEISNVAISGKMTGLADGTALIQSDGKIGSVSVQRIDGGAGEFSGAIVSGHGSVKSGRTASISIAQSITGSTGANSGSIIIDGSLGNFTAGALAAATIRANDDIASLTINGNVADSTITARGAADPGVTTDVAIGSVKITGAVSNTSILAGYDIFGNAANADAQIGKVRVTGAWTASTLAAGVAPGADGKFGTSDDTPIAGHDRALVVSKIASIIIGGAVTGSAATDDHFGFIAEQIGAFSSPGFSPALNVTPGQSFDVPGTDDVTVREVV